MSKKKQPSRRRKPAVAAHSPIVLDVQINFSTHITQHVAVKFLGDAKLEDWTREEIQLAAEQVTDLLPIRDALDIGTATWSRGHLRFTVGNESGSYPFISVEIRDVPLATFVRCFDRDVFHASSFFYRGAWKVRAELEHAPIGASPESGTLRDEYPERDRRTRDFAKVAARREANELAAIQAARRAAGLPLLPIATKRGKAA